ncbi:MAG: MauE/DoxX family redox-associated membrane protein [Acidimicrobiales bacterium]
MELIGLYLVAAALLVAAGVAKAIRPGDMARALASAFHLAPDRLRLGVRVLAVAEAVLGVVALIWPEPVPAALVAASYLGFTAVLLMVRARGGALASCGCFGRPDTPVTMVHTIADLCLGAAAVAVAAAGRSGSVLSLLAAQPGRGVPLVATSLLAAWLTVLVMDQLSRLVAVRRLVGISHSRAG